MGSPTDEARGAPSGEPAARPVPAAWFAPWVGFGLLGVAVIFLVIAARPLLLPVVVAAMFTLVLSEPVRRLRAAGIPESVGAGVVVAASLGGTGEPEHQPRGAGQPGRRVVEPRAGHGA